ncbi:helicase associated domain-containing protein [Microbacterium paraoxydans]|uniref:Helicase associated domain-containing protein n=1 Tax=Microbacterium paraoxydans TaxID=199592 RepID=A0A1H1X2X0_9MICO|nr:Helicase associated domain-containing protein [Microbacterium paraoxydans]
MHTPRKTSRSRRDRGPWWAAYERVAEHAYALGRLPRLSDGVPADVVGWAAGQRRATMLTADQKAALRALPGWSDRPRADAWEERAEELRRFIAAEGRLPRVRGTLPGESALAHWVSRQRVAEADGRLSPERVRLLAYATRSI